MDRRPAGRRGPSYAWRSCSRWRTAGDPPLSGVWIYRDGPLTGIAAVESYLNFQGNRSVNERCPTIEP